MALLTLGLNHNTAPVALREKLAFPTREAIGDALSDLRGHLRSLAPEAAILSTCNRTEIYCKTDAPDEAGPALTEWIGRHRGADTEAAAQAVLLVLANLADTIVEIFETHVLVYQLCLRLNQPATLVIGMAA